jgi:choline kinase
MTPLDLNASPDMAPQRQTDFERAHQDSLEAEAQLLMRQTRLWRVLNSAQWVAWGIVQAKVPEVEDEDDDEVKTPTAGPPPVDCDVDEADEFDYLAYAQDRAMFFWADLVSLGFVRKDQLPPLLAEHVEARVIDY